MLGDLLSDEDQNELNSLTSSIETSQTFNKKDSLIQTGKSNDEIIASLTPQNQKMSFLRKAYLHTELNFMRNKGKGAVVVFFSQLSIVIIINVVFLSLIFSLLYIRSNYHLPEHFIHIIYLVNFLFILGLCCAMLYLLWASIYWFYFFLVCSLLYMFISMKTFYNQSYLKTIVKCVSIVVFCLPVLLALSILIMGFLSIYHYGQ